MPAHPGASARPTNLSPQPGFTILSGTLEVAEDATQGTSVVTIAPNDPSDTRWRFSINNSKFQLANDYGVSAAIQRSGTGVLDAGQAPTEAVDLTVTDKWGQPWTYNLAIAVQDTGGGDVEPTYSATGTINTNDGVAEGAVFGTASPTNTPIPGDLNSVEIDGGSSLFDVDFVGATVRFKRKASSNWTAQIGNPQVVQVNYVHAAGSGSFERTINIADSSASFLVESFTIPKDTGGGTQAAGWCSHLFGRSRPQGLIPGATHPQYKVGGVFVPHMVIPYMFWPDGSWRHYAVSIYVDEEVSGSSIAVEEWTGGAAGTSGKTVSDFEGIDGGSGGPGVRFTHVANLGAGDWDATVLGGLADAIKIVEYGEGPAGKLIRVTANAKQSGTPHGQLTTDFYLHMMLDGEGNVLGYRMQEAFGALYGDQASPTPNKLQFTAVVFEDGPANVLRNVECISSTNGTTTSSTVSLNHYTKEFGCGVKARWDFVQGDGSASADCVMGLATFDKDLMLGGQLIPNLRTDITPTGITTAAEYRPMCRGNYGTYNLNSGSERMVLDNTASHHFSRQDEVSEQNIRADGLAQSTFRSYLRSKDTQNIFPSIDRPAGGSYGGMGPSRKTYRYRSTDTSTGFVTATDKTSLWSQEGEAHHRPNGAGYAFVVTGSPEFADLCVELPGGTLFAQPFGPCTIKAPPWTGNNPYTGSSGRAFAVDGVTYQNVFFQQGTGVARGAAWLTRDVAFAYIGAHCVAKDGSEIVEYLEDLIEQAALGINDLHAEHSATWVEHGIHNFRSSNTYNGWDGTMSAIATTFLSIVRPEDTALREHAEYRADYLKKMKELRWLGAIAAERTVGWWDDGIHREDIRELFYQCSNVQFVFDPGADTVTIGTGVNSGLVFTDGDMMMYSAGLQSTTRPSAAMIDFKPFLLINITGGGKTAQLAPLDAPSTPIDITFNGSNGHMYLSSPIDPGSIKSFQGNTAYHKLTLSHARLAKAAGIAGMDEIIAQLDGYYTDAEMTVTADTRHALTNAGYPS